jgi:hypothetical protein
MSPKLLELVRALARGEQSWPLYLWSPGPGTGKTSAAMVMLDHYGPLRHETTFTPEVSDFMFGFADFAALPELFREADRKRFYCSSPHACDTLYPSDLWSWVRSAKLLVLDDLRKPGDREQRLGDDHYGILKRVLDERVAKPLVITSNLNPAEEPGGGVPELVRVFDSRIASRIVCGTVYKLGGRDRRLG